MARRVFVSLPSDLVRRIDLVAQRAGKTRGEIVRDALARIAPGPKRSAEGRAEVLKRAAALRAKQARAVDAAALTRAARDELERRAAHPGRRPRKDLACRGRREPARGRVTPGFQQGMR